MHGYGFYGGFHAALADVITLAWSEPMRDLAAKVGVSDVGLKKTFRSYGVEPPPQGHWNKVHAGRPVSKPPQAPPRAPGAAPYVVVGENFRGLLPEAPRLSPNGPFASALVPEDLEELRTLTIAAIGRVSVPRDLSKPADALLPLLKREEQRRQKQAGLEPGSFWWNHRGPVFANTFNQRRLRLANGLLQALGRRGVGASVDAKDGDLSIDFRVGRQRVVVTIDMAKQPRQGRTYNINALHAEATASTPMGIWLDGMHPRQTYTSPPATFTDKPDEKLEKQIAAIAAEIIVAGERRFRVGIRDTQEWEDRERLRLENERLQRRAAAEAARLAALQVSGELLRKAREVRELVVQVKAAVLAGQYELAGDQLTAWEQWALAHADSLDPVKSGQVSEHLQYLEVG